MKSVHVQDSDEFQKILDERHGIDLGSSVSSYFFSVDQEYFNKSETKDSLKLYYEFLDKTIKKIPSIDSIPSEKIKEWIEKSKQMKENIQDETPGFLKLRLTNLPYPRNISEKRVAHRIGRAILCKLFNSKAEADKYVKIISYSPGSIIEKLLIKGKKLVGGLIIGVRWLISNIFNLSFFSTEAGLPEIQIIPEIPSPNIKGNYARPYLRVLCL